MTFAAITVTLAPRVPGARPVARDNVEVDAALIDTLDGVAARAVPASEIRDIGGWLARRSPGLATKRVNSVLAYAHPDDSRLERKLSAVERFYGERGLPSRYQVTPVSQPPALKDRLLARGYVKDAPTAVRTCDLTPLARLPATPGLAVELAAAPSDVWCTTWQASLGVDRLRAGAVAALFDRIGTETAFAVVKVDGLAAGVALGVLDDRWLGIFNMATLPAHRRHGVGRSALSALASWGLRSGAAVGYLQVDLDNQPATGLYDTAGFKDAYQYVYFSRDTPP